jgi:hypothetical protein
MNDETQVAEELHAFAHAIVAKRTHRRGGCWREDAAQELVLLEWQCAATRDRRLGQTPDN